MTSKYRNRITHVDGYKFDSYAESVRYNELKLLERAGLISGLKVHPRYLILDGFTDWTGKQVKLTYYEADFEYFERGRVVVEDVKGVRTDVFKLKSKMFRQRYPAYDFKEIAA